MQSSSGKTRARPHWPCAAALALILAAPPAFADDDEPERRETAEKSPWNTSEVVNPCVKNPATSGKGERLAENMRCETGNCGTLRTETRTKRSNGRTETRERTRGDGFGTGEIDNVRYSLALDHTVVTRTTKKDSRTVSFHREMGQPQRSTLPVSGSSSCTPTSITLEGCASPFAVTTVSETNNGSPKPPRTFTDTECKNRDGSKRGENDD